MIGPPLVGLGVRSNCHPLTTLSLILIHPLVPRIRDHVRIVNLFRHTYVLVIMFMHDLDSFIMSVGVLWTLIIHNDISCL